MKKIYSIIFTLTVVVFGVGATGAHGQEEVSPTAAPVRMEIKETRLQIEDMRKARLQMQANREATTASMAKKRATIEETRLKKRATLQEGLKKVRDEKKQAVVERLDGRLDEINAKHTAAYESHLDKLDGILARITDAAEAAATAGTDMTAISADITAAGTAITTARTAVTSQTGKTYPITITDETKLGTAVSSAQTSLRADLAAVHKTVLAAREKVRAAEQALKLSSKPQ